MARLPPLARPIVITVCTGKSCTDKKARKTSKRLKKLVERRGLDALVQVRKSRCLKACGKGPVVLVEPGGHRFKKVKPTRAPQVLDEVVRSNRTA
ncbi:MAG TPA: (2Fe-2S) ferredoxin domain-containing protein [Candidatus Hydrogenedentes bacterium]|nr:(2Fe-2S) ferredoxin domain-containing protein [Candidatus Hydrogenedentota bacterium]